MDMIRLLITNGVDKSGVDRDGATALHWGIICCTFRRFSDMLNTYLHRDVCTFTSKAA